MADLWVILGGALGLVVLLIGFFSKAERIGGERERLKTKEADDAAAKQVREDVGKVEPFRDPDESAEYLRDFASRRGRKPKS